MKRFQRVAECPRAEGVYVPMAPYRNFCAEAAARASVKISLGCVDCKSACRGFIIRYSVQFEGQHVIGKKERERRCV